MRPSAAARQRGSVRQMPKPGEDLEKQADAGRRRAVVGVAGTRARHVGGVGGGEINAALAVAERSSASAASRRAVSRSSGSPAGLEQGERGARHRGVIVEHAARSPAPVAPGMQQAAVGAAQARGG